MQSSHRFVPMLDVRPDAVVFGSRFAVDELVSLHRHDAVPIDEIITHQLIRGIEDGLIRIIKNDPQKAAAIMKMESVHTPSDRPWHYSIGRRETTYSLKLAIMHPDKLRELEQADLDRDAHIKAETQLAQTITELRKELAAAKLKAARYDQLLADIAAAVTTPADVSCGCPQEADY